MCRRLGMTALLVSLQKAANAEKYRERHQQLSLAARIRDTTLRQAFTGDKLLSDRKQKVKFTLTSTKLWDDTAVL